MAGYELAPRLVEQVDDVSLKAVLSPRLGELHWFEVVRTADVPLPGPATELLEEAQNKLRTVTTVTVQGEPFWASTEIVMLPELVTRTIDALAREP